MKSSDSQPNYYARMQTPYMNTTGMCLELYFQSKGSSTVSKPVIAVIAVDEEQDETVVASSDGLERHEWDRMFAALPSGVYRVVIEGLRSSSGYSSMSVDDVVVQACPKFGEFLFCDVISSIRQSISQLIMNFRVV